LQATTNVNGSYEKEDDDFSHPLCIITKPGDNHRRGKRMGNSSVTELKGRAVE
jgi:hypothetical protein